jgi:hypothetical protein
MNPCGDERVSTGRGAAVVGARFKGNYCGGSPRARSGLPQRFDFSVGTTGAAMKTGADDRTGVID